MLLAETSRLPIPAHCIDLLMPRVDMLLSKCCKHLIDTANGSQEVHS